HGRRPRGRQRGARPADVVPEAAQAHRRPAVRLPRYRVVAAGGQGRRRPPAAHRPGLSSVASFRSPPDGPEPRGGRPAAARSDTRIAPMTPRYLVIQGLEVQTRDLKAIAKIAGAARIENTGDNAFRLHEYRSTDGVAQYCAAAKLDFAFVPQPRKLADFRLL